MNKNVNKKIITILLCFCFLSTHMHGYLFFGSNESKIVVRNDGTFTLDKPLDIQNGTIFTEKTGKIAGENIHFINGTYNNNGSSGFFGAGTLNPTVEKPVPTPTPTPPQDPINIDGTIFYPVKSNEPAVQNTIHLAERDNLIVGAGDFRSQVFVEKSLTGDTSLLNGQPLFHTNNRIDLEDDVTGLIMSIQTAFNTDLYFNGGSIILQDNLNLGDNAKFHGPGQIVLNNRTLSLGGASNTWEGIFLWNSALDIQLDSFTRVKGTWAFIGDGQINGNGNVLDISEGGRILILGNAKLNLTSVKLKGLGTGSIQMDKESQIRLSDTEIEMDLERTDSSPNPVYTINSGGIYVEGPTNIITKNNILQFSETASLTVDRVALTYDPLETVDQFNIRPLRIQDPNHKFVTIIHNGSIRRIRQESISFVDYSSDSALQRYAVLFPDRPMRVFPETINGQINKTIRVNGNTQFLGFTQADEPLLFVSDDIHVTYENILFRDFSPKHLSLGNEKSELIFGDKTTVRFAQDEDLNYTLTFQGNTALKGGGAILTLGPKGKIVVQPNITTQSLITGETGSTLTLDGLIIKNVSGEKIQCTDDNCKIVLKNIEWYQDDNFYFKKGSLDILTTCNMYSWTLSGDCEFEYMSDQPCTILPNATLSILRNMVFHYAPPSKRSDLLVMTNETSTFYIEYSSLSAPYGLTLINGRLILSQRNFLYNDDATSISQGIIFGNGEIAHNLTIERSGGATLELQSGFQQTLNVF
ncbi:MAG: hypothetical protein ABH827_00800 [bacterium]